MRWLDGITNSTDMGLGGLWELVIGRPGVLRFLGYRKELDTTEQLNWTELKDNRDKVSNKKEWKQRLCSWHRMTEYDILRVISHPYTSHLWLQGKAFSNVLKQFFLTLLKPRCLFPIWLFMKSTLPRRTISHNQMNTSLRLKITQNHYLKWLDQWLNIESLLSSSLYLQWNVYWGIK